MPKKLSTKDFIEKAKNIHGGKYNYDKVKYILSNKKVIITCPIHGDFKQKPNGHLDGKGCINCKIEKIANIKRTDVDSFISESDKVHNNKYSYSKVEYKNRFTKVKITCPIHGDFEQVPGDHLNGRGCRLCGVENSAKSRSLTTDEFIQKAKQVHGDKYDYSKVDYINSLTELIIICSDHGQFKQKPYSHLYGNGCKKCTQSKGENLISNILKNNNINFEIEYKIPGIKEKYNKEYEYDFYLPDYNLLIEFHGIQHFEYNKYFHKTYNDFEKQIFRDESKREHAYAWGYKYLEINYTFLKEITKEEFERRLIRCITLK